MLVEIAIGVIAMIVGFFIGRFGGAKSRQATKAHEQRMEKAEQELAEYRENVTAHFQGTAQLIERMNENYREVYHHLAQGAQQLTDCETTLQAVEPLNIAQQSAAALPQTVEKSHAEIPAESVAEKVVENESEGRDQAVSARQAGL
ncbi:MAG: YhcB family protein [Gammaproteobacteria bacterium]|nr:YhcB family protein [Gammaproteobacteria bacterium]MCF6229444.1 YhcB family protein [Gammaproteobacteria bacterium]